MSSGAAFSPRRSSRRVLVVLSAYNGARYIGEQIESILAQQGCDSLSLLIRDDGSSDATVQIAQSVSDSRLSIEVGANIGVTNSFFTLVKQAQSKEWDYLAFADQDDVWLPNKLQRALAALAAPGEPALYCSALALVDAELTPLKTHIHTAPLTFENGFLANAATGCTTVLTRSMFELMEPLPRPSAVHSHDWWFYLVALAFGRVVYDAQSSILYRQHEANHLGLPQGASLAYAFLKRRFRRRAYVRRGLQAEEFLRVYGEKLTESQRGYLLRLASSRGSLIRRAKFVRHDWPSSMGAADHRLRQFAFLLGVT